MNVNVELMKLFVEASKTHSNAVKSGDLGVAWKAWKEMQVLNRMA